MTIIITGGPGFCGSAVAWHIVNNTDDEVLVLDSLTYGVILNPIAGSQHFAF
jgi:dTDP-glucose 4,6-dehydratase